MSFFFVVCMHKATIMHILDSNSSNTLIQTPTGLPEAFTFKRNFQKLGLYSVAAAVFHYYVASACVAVFFKKHSSLPLLAMVALKLDVLQVTVMMI